jgi:hypothetical protein
MLTPFVLLVTGDNQVVAGADISEGECPKLIPLTDPLKLPELPPNLALRSDTICFFNP